MVISKRTLLLFNVAGIAGSIGFHIGTAAAPQPPPITCHEDESYLRGGGCIPDDDIAAWKIARDFNNGAWHD
jgi:hypothetical protein